MSDFSALQEFALKIRRDVLAMAFHAGGAHIAPAYSITDILVVLYESFLKMSPQSLENPERDRFILSKGHGCASLYALLAEKGYFPREELRRFCKPEGILGGHPDRRKVPGVEASTGSLGHGFVFSVGVAYAGALRERNFRTYAILGDGECQEGSIWEAALLAAQLKLSKLTAFIDYNKHQGMGRVKEISDLSPLKEKWESFGWASREINGHDYQEITDAVHWAHQQEKPTMIVAHTVKGKGLSFMEDQTVWHYKLPKEGFMDRACQELGLTCPIDQVLP